MISAGYGDLRSQSRRIILPNFYTHPKGADVFAINRVRALQILMQATEIGFGFHMLEKHTSESKALNRETGYRVVAESNPRLQVGTSAHVASIPP